MKIEVISLGGSLLVPEKMDYKFLHDLRKLVLSFRDRKFVIVVGGGSVSRKYMNALESLRIGTRQQCLMGIGATRLNARFLMYVFGGAANKSMPNSLQEINNLLAKKRIVIAGALRFIQNNTSDGTAALIAKFFRAQFINMTNVRGLYTKDPSRYRDAKLIRKISKKDFRKMAGKMRYHPGQHFVLDQRAADILSSSNISAKIIGKDLKNLRNLLNGKRFIGTTIE